MTAMFALLDCNNFYVSCERLFQPALLGKPVVCSPTMMAVSLPAPTKPRPLVFLWAYQRSNSPISSKRIPLRSFRQTTRSTGIYQHGDDDADAVDSSRGGLLD